ncbi:MAG: type II toxin-antitoxin system VapC family toxin [Verrucomicrobiota bacterium]
MDSHALLWWLEGDARLSPQAKALLESGQRVIVSAVSLWELRMKERRGLIEPMRPVREWLPLLGQLELWRVEAVDGETWSQVADLEWEHRDPADRMIAVTALRHGVAVLTKDRRFHEEGSPVEAVW